jgi:hypothetical protein
MSSFHGKTDTPKPARALRTWRINAGEPDERTVHAHYLNWGTGHVLFWEDRPDGTPDHLVLALANGEARTVEEVAPSKLQESLHRIQAARAELEGKLVKRPVHLDEDLHALDEGGR